MNAVDTAWSYGNIPSDDTYPNDLYFDEREEDDDGEVTPGLLPNPPFPKLPPPLNPPPND